MKIIINGQTISKKNSKRIVPTQNGKSRVISSAPYLQWAEAAKWQLAGYQPRPWRYPVRVRFTFYRQNAHRFDYNNLSQGPLDLLVEAGILADDDMTHVTPEFAGWQVDKIYPRVEIEILEG